LLGISPVVASSAIKRLEKTLEIRLFERTTRRLRITAEGGQYLTHARSALRSMADGEVALASLKNEYKRQLRLSLPSDLGRNHLLDWIEDHLRGKSETEVRISIGDGLEDLHAVPVDLTVRYGKPKDSSLVYLPIAEENARVLCASPAYIDRHGPINSIRQLAEHDCLRFQVGGVIYSKWLFGAGAPLPALQVQGTRVTDDAELVRRWAIRGLGIAYKSELDIADDLRAGRLVRILPDVPGEPAPLGMLAVHRNFLTPDLLSLVRWLRRCCEALVDDLYERERALL
jgi:DNA-binding transcriptional LysR family regulator